MIPWGMANSRHNGAVNSRSAGAEEHDNRHQGGGKFFLRQLSGLIFDEF